MKAASPHLYRRGKRGTYYLRRRIPIEVLDAYRGGVREIVRSLRTRDPHIAERTPRSALVDLDREFALKSARLREQRRLPRQQRVTTLAPEQRHDLAKVWVTAVLETDEQARRNGLDEAEFQSLGERIAAQRSELGPMLAREIVPPGADLPIFR